MAAASIGNIHVALYVNTAQTRNFTSAAEIIDRDSKRMRTALSGTERSVTSLQRRLNDNLRFRMASESLRTLSRATDDFNRLRAAMLGVAAVAGTGVAGTFGGAYLLQTADKAKLLANQLRTVTKDTADLANVQERLFDVSQRTRTGLQATTTIYARTARATESLGLSQQKLLDITETIQKSFAIGGASTAEATGAAIQLSQGIASDRFSGEEFRSVAENAPVLLRGIAESLGVNIGKLREMAHAGELTAKTVTEAILKAKDRIDAEFAKTTPTLGQSLVQVENAWIRYIGDTDKAYGITNKMAAALKGLADNFDDVMYWVSRVGGGLALLWGAKMVGQRASTIVDNVSASSAALRNEIKGYAKEIEANNVRRAEIAKQMSDIAVGARAEEAKIIGDRAAKIHKLKEVEYNAAQGVIAVEKQRAALADQLVNARTGAISRLQREVEIARQAVRDDALRVAQAQEAALAEERNLRARQAQRVAAANDVVQSRAGGVAQTGNRLAEAQAALAKEKEIAKAKISGEIEARRQAIVTNTLRLRSTQDRIAELRPLQRFGGFEKEFGDSYRKLLGDQQKFMASTAKAREEVKELGEKLAALDRGEAITRGISAAMNRHAAAVKSAQTAVTALGVAEARRNAIAAEPIAGKTLESRLKAEAAELARYEGSIGNLQAKMRALSEATSGAFDTKATRRLTAEIDALNGKLLAARNNLLQASNAVAAAEANNAHAVGAAMAVRQKALADYVVLENEARDLIVRSTDAIEKQAAAHRNLNVIRRAGANFANGFLNFFGGGVGLSITAGLVALGAVMAHYTAKAQKAAEQTENVNRLLRDMGYLADGAADGVDNLQKSIEEGRISKLQSEVQDFQREINKTVDLLKEMELGIGDVAAARVGAFKATPGASTRQQDEELQAWMKAIAEIRTGVGTPLEEIRDRLIDGKEMSAEMRKSLEDMALANPDIASIVLTLIQAGERLNALNAATKDWIDGIRQARAEADKLPGEGYRESEIKSLDDLEKFDLARVDKLRERIRKSGLSTEERELEERTDAIIKQFEEEDSYISRKHARREAEEELKRENAVKKREEAAKAAEDAAKRQADAFADLDFQVLIAPLDEFQQKMIETARSAGASTEEVKQFVEALRSNDLSAIPEKFRVIAESMQEVADIEFARKLGELKEQNLTYFLSETDKETLRLARSFGIAEPKVRAFIDALLAGDAASIPDEFAKIRTEVEKLAANEKLEEFADGAANAFGDFFRSAITGAEGFKEALGNLLKRLGDLILEIFVIQPIIEGLKNAFKGGLSGGTGASAGSAGGSFDLGGLVSAFVGAAGSALTGGASGAVQSAASAAAAPKAIVSGVGRAVDLAGGLIGLNESANPSAINSFLKAGGIDISAAQTAWCAAFVNSSLKQIGINGSGSLTANSFLNWGKGVDASSVLKGDVLVESRGLPPNVPGGHVGFATGATRISGGVQQLEMLSGNTNGGAVDTEWVDAVKLDIRRAAEDVGSLSDASEGAVDGLGDLGKGLTDFGSKLSSATVGGGGGGGGGFGDFLSKIFSGFGGGSAADTVTGSMVVSPRLLAEGGYTGHGGKWDPAGLAHAGEYIFSAQATRRAGVKNLDAMHKSLKGYADGGLVGGGVGGGGIGGGGTSRILVELSPELVASILEQAAGQSVEITRVGVEQLAKQTPSMAINAVADARARNVEGV